VPITAVRWSQPSALQIRMNRSRCHLGRRLARIIRVSVKRCPAPPHPVWYCDHVTCRGQTVISKKSQFRGDVLPRERVKPCALCCRCANRNRLRNKYSILTVKLLDTNEVDSVDEKLKWLEILVLQFIFITAWFQGVTQTQRSVQQSTTTRRQLIAC